MDTIETGQEIKAVFNIKQGNTETAIWVTCAYTGQFSEYNGNKMYWFENSKTGTEYPFTKKQLESFAEAQERHNEDVINF